MLACGTLPERIDGRGSTRSHTPPEPVCGGDGWPRFAAQFAYFVARGPRAQSVTPLLDADVARLSPYMRRHINFHGHYSFAPADLGGSRRALRDPDAPDDD